MWAYPSSIVPLSYRLHAQLANEHNGRERWGYRHVNCGQISAIGRPKTVRSEDGDPNKTSVSLQKKGKGFLGGRKAASIPDDLDWVLRENVISYEEMGNPDHTAQVTAQVHPYQFTTSIAQLAEASGVKIIIGRATGINRDANTVQSVSYDDRQTDMPTTIPADVVVITAGPWTRSVYPQAPISALRAHSVTIRPSRPVSAYALFTDITLPADFDQTGKTTKARSGRSVKRVSPEIYARPNNEVYACGEGDTLVALPEFSDLVQVDEKRCQDIVDYVSSISDELRNGEVTARQACYLPNVTGAASGPLIGETGVKGLLMATGHTCWGIQNAPATGKLMSEFVFDGKAKSANIGALDPRRVL